MANVNFLHNQADFRVVLMGAMGFSDAYIKSVTGFSGGQIYYRLKLAKVRRAAYRNGESKFALLAVNLAADKISAQLERTAAIKQIH